MPTKIDNDEQSVMKQTRKEGRERIQLDLSPEAVEALDELKEKSHAATRAETIRNALLFYSWLINDVQPESVIQVVEDGKITTSFKARLLKGLTKP
jgi:hypothetical protein